MDRTEVLNLLSNGNLVLSIKAAKNICEYMEVPFTKDMVISWDSPQEAMERYGIQTNVTDCGVEALILGYHIIHDLLREEPLGTEYVGRLSQAKANAKQIAAFFEQNQ